MSLLPLIDTPCLSLLHDDNDDSFLDIIASLDIEAMNSNKSFFNGS